MDGRTSVSIVILAYGIEAHLADCVAAVLRSRDHTGSPVDLELIVVDNGASAAVALVPADDRIRVISPPRNLGFAGGCNLGARAARGEYLVFVNSDAIAEPGAVAALTTALGPPDVGIVSASVRLADTPELMNTAGNPVHFLGVAWAGSFGESFTRHRERTDIASATGAMFALKATTWRALGGFDDEYFAYHEDVDLSLRSWQRGLRVQFEPAAVALHFYVFSRNPMKQYLLERNRWITVLTVFPRPALTAALVAAPLFELLLCGVAAMQGWLPDKLRSYRWLITHRRYLRERRCRVQRESTITDAAFLRLLSSRIEPAGLERPPGLGVLNAVLATYWKVVLKLCRVSGPAS